MAAMRSAIDIRPVGVPSVDRFDLPVASAGGGAPTATAQRPPCQRWAGR
jgi:hypothetical protein